MRVSALRGRLVIVVVGLSLCLFGGQPARGDTKSALKKIAGELNTALRQGKAKKVGILIGRLSKIDDPGVVRFLLGAAIGIPSASNYDRAVRAISEYREETTLRRLIEQISKAKDVRHRVLVLDGFGRRSDAASRDAVYGALKQKVVHVQVAAIQACVDRQEKEAVPVLIDLLQREQKRRSRSWIETRRALLELTAQDFEIVSDWRKFWEGSQDTLNPRKLDRSKGPTAVVVKKRDDSVEFFGTEIFSENVAFIIDVSGSMRLYDPDPAYEGGKEAIDRQRLRRAKFQLLKALKRLKKSSRFNVLTFSDRVVSWKKKILSASRKNLRSAGKFVNGFKATGLTHTDDAFEKAFKDTTIDTIVLLTDGSPFKQNRQDVQAFQEDILQRVKDLNASRKLTINTFGFEGPGVDPDDPQPVKQPPPGTEFVYPMVEFLKKLATENGGMYRPIK